MNTPTYRSKSRSVVITIEAHSLVPFLTLCQMPCLAHATFIITFGSVSFNPKTSVVGAHAPLVEFPKRSSIWNFFRGPQMKKKG